MTNSKASILIVEDDANIRETLSTLLQQKGYATETAKNGKEALQKIDDILPNIIFMDIKLPGENGLELTKKIKDLYRMVIIIILTAYDLPEYQKAAIRNGADYFILKGSSTANEILALVESILSDMKLNDKGKMNE